MTVERGKGWEMHLGDCIEVMPTIGMVDAVVTDPPYDARTHAGAVKGYGVASVRARDTGVPFASLVDASALAAALLAASRRWALAFCTFEQIADYVRGAGAAWVRTGVWDKIAPGPQVTGDRPAAACDAIAIMHAPGRKRWNRGGGAGIWRHMPSQGAERPDHPTPKPVPLMLALVADFTDTGETILDPFAGSGTTGVACLRLGRKFIGIEKDPTYFALACERLRAEEQGTTLQAARAGQLSLLGGK